jgi:hypothetical protein
MLTKARVAAGLDSLGAGIVVHRDADQWKRWESGKAPMDPALFELWTLKVSRWCSAVRALAAVETSYASHELHKL